MEILKKVNYDATNWHLIADLLVANHASVHRINRAQVVLRRFLSDPSPIIVYPCQ